VPGIATVRAVTVALVHGVPETTVVWEPLVGELGHEDVACLPLPGFGTPLPDGFEPTMDAYAAWLADELARLGDVDLVGHDWGALLSLRVLADRPANVRSWAVDAGDLGEDFRWHDLALVWQTPGEGEAFMDGLLAAPIEERAALLVASGVPAEGAHPMAACFDATMAAAILGLYRSATEIGTTWDAGLDAIEAPGLVLASGRDPFRAPGRAERLARRTGAQLVELPDAGHWWMLEDPGAAAAALSQFWAALER